MSELREGGACAWGGSDRLVGRAYVRQYGYSVNQQFTGYVRPFVSRDDADLSVDMG